MKTGDSNLASKDKIFLYGTSLYNSGQSTIIFNYLNQNIAIYQF
jgi:hypothetical protein